MNELFQIMPSFYIISQVSSFTCIIFGLDKYLLNNENCRYLELLSSGILNQNNKINCYMSLHPLTVEKKLDRTLPVRSLDNIGSFRCYLVKSGNKKVF